MTEDWSLEGKQHEFIDASSIQFKVKTDNDIEYLDRDDDTLILEEWYKKEDIETLLEKLIEYIKKPCWVCNGAGCYECGHSGISPIYDVKEVINVINKRFGKKE